MVLFDCIGEIAARGQVVLLKGKSMVLVQFWGNADGDVFDENMPCWYYDEDDEPESGPQYYFGSPRTAAASPFCVDLHRDTVKSHFLLTDKGEVPVSLMKKHFDMCPRPVY
jgi:hypothetical protein